jgi:hypothetical protein
MVQRSRLRPSRRPLRGLLGARGCRFVWASVNRRSYERARPRPGASRRRGREGRFGTLRPLSAGARRILSGFGASRNAVVVLVGIPRRRQARASWGFPFKTRSNPHGLGSRTVLVSPCGREKNAVRRRAACPGTGVAIPDGAAPRPRPLTRETRPSWAEVGGI